ncbi:DUF4340 domain-containing protein [[Limnothrix rosea] IAM M-220]|uniref:DUF4340 domain-containing protein n=1 Tax=[Limnothrix rosea] IAM M-220 TaxID=454133 RepID=UPI00095F4948|nr:DUF4340 domain-containing protein [[Limnothrix rosea] IAM M-220]OKH17766.1 hypothetical protein NIES208_08050 [[Limnothrix rosea] IAM M-220]
MTGLQRRTIVCLLTAIFCGGLAIALSHIFPTPVAESVDFHPLFSIAEMQLIGFTIFVQGETLDFERQGTLDSSWRMVTPQTAPVSRVKIQHLISLLTSHRPSKSFMVASENLVDYGLDAPFASVILKFNDGSVHRLAFGHNNYDQSKVYARVDGTLEVRVLSSTFLEAVNRELYEWLETEAIAEIVI